MKKRKTLLIVISILIAILLTTVILVLCLKKEPVEVDADENINVEELEMEFSELFNNTESEYVGTLYNIEEEQSGKYKIEAQIPYIFIQTDIDTKINKEVSDLFVNELLKIMNESEKYTILKIDYATNVNKNIVSLAIRCVLKEGNNAQRTIIKTYNYDMENQKEIGIMDVVPTEKKDSIQNLINEEIEKQIKKEETIAKQGYNIYRRNKDSEIYTLKNATEFYIKDDILYIIYSYGNNSYTSEIDLIINKI